MINLKGILEQFPDAVNNRSKLKSILLDLYPEEKRNAHILMKLYEEGIVIENLRKTSNIPARFLTRLEFEYGIASQFSMSLISLWQEALGDSKTVSQPVISVAHTGNNTSPKSSANVPKGMNSSRHREWVESIIGKLSSENPSITYKTYTVKDTPVYLNGEKVLDIYYRKDSVRIYVKYGTKQYQIYKSELSKLIAYQKNTADPTSTNGEYAFFVDDENIESVLRKLLIDNK